MNLTDVIPMCSADRRRPHFIKSLTDRAVLGI